MTPAIREEDGYAIIRIPLEDVHSLRVALAPCPCRAPKSNETQNIRARLARGLRKIGTRKEG